VVSEIRTFLNYLINTGYSSSEVLGAECSLFIESSEGNRRANHDKKNRTNSPYECVIRTKDGRKIHAIRTSFKLTAGTGKPFGVITSLTRHGGLKATESEPMTADQIKEFRQKAKEICHELKKSLKAVSGYTQMVLNYGEYDWRQKKYLERIIHHVDRLEHIAFQLRSSIENGIAKPSGGLSF
jgi:nitrogen-specific signal transduction histidine kinase